MITLLENLSYPEVEEYLGKKDIILVPTGPTVKYGVSSHHMAFRGTVSLMPDTMIILISDIIESLVTHGFRRIVFINGHGGNISSIKIAIERLKARMIEGCFEVISWYEMEEVRQLSIDLFTDKEGHHATPSEVSITKYLRAEAFETKPVHELQVTNPKYYWPLTSEEMKKAFPDGRMESAPWLATADHGRKILKEACRAIQIKIEKIMLLKML